MEEYVSIPSSGSIQFLLNWAKSPVEGRHRSQSPQAGQFNSYYLNDGRKFEPSGQSLNPLKRVNSILTQMNHLIVNQISGLCLNPLKRVNSILTIEEGLQLIYQKYQVSIPSSGSIQFLQRRVEAISFLTD